MAASIIDDTPTLTIEFKPIKTSPITGFIEQPNSSLITLKMLEKLARSFDEAAADAQELGEEIASKSAIDRARFLAEGIIDEFARLACEWRIKPPLAMATFTPKGEVEVLFRFTYGAAMVVWVSQNGEIVTGRWLEPNLQTRSLPTESFA